MSRDWCERTKRCQKYYHSHYYSKPSKSERGEFFDNKTQSKSVKVVFFSVENLIKNVKYIEVGGTTKSKKILLCVPLKRQGFCFFCD
jgi:hypothetical protein